MNHQNSIIAKIIEGTFDTPRMENTMRGIFAEYMVAEALGPRCKVVGRDWYPWDLQIGADDAVFPDRIRIQIKNTAALQSWRNSNAKPSKCQWTLKAKKLQRDFERWYPSVPSETYGHHCDLYVLCHHSVECPVEADHRDVNQWDFYLVPVIGSHAMFEPGAAAEADQLAVAFTATPKSLKSGARGHQPIKPLCFDDLNEEALRRALGIDE